MSTTWTIIGATLPDGSTTDLHISNGVFVEEAPTGAERIDARGLRAQPGLVDLHTHLREPGGEEAETITTGTAAAARGGFTATFAMANTNPATDTPERAEQVRRLAAGASTEVVPIGSVTKGLAGEELSDIAGMNSRAGVTVFSDDGFSVPSAGLVRAAMEQLLPFDGVLAEHCQDQTLAGSSACCHEGPVSEELGHVGWPTIAESVVIARDVQIAQYLGARLHICHVSTAEGVEVLRWAKARGVRVTAEVMPHHLLLTVDELRTGDTTYRVNPPLRSPEDVEAVRQALAEGIIEIVATDHAPHRKQDKDKPFPEAKPGMVAIEHVLSVVIETMINQGRLSWSGLADRMSHRPAQIGRLAHQGRPVAVGEPANLVLVDPAARSLVDREQALSKGRNNPYHGRNLPDPVVATFWRGRQTFSR
ncbi:dihydroorotase [Aestuariimicrobium sp. p3-SID1156]|uniref:dihydroorotase n=1 Tax=Aestuariimicrobium sp. p3-SID1156 TaxID=2916038 RepID=UPI00223C0B2C|nr:dihydroorotase [Aestuariimicrobium sp. p3-SID1156]MCT1459772.1 dihydroorotase [Aestuariimicrobium sp. p3-SID1156]